MSVEERQQWGNDLSPGGEDRAWEARCRQARHYLAAGAWQSAHDLLTPHLAAFQAPGDLPVAAAEALALRLAACLRLGHEAHVAHACRLLRACREVEAQGGAEARLLRAHALAGDATRCGAYEEARRWLATIDPQVASSASSCTRARVALLAGHIEAVAGREHEAETHGLHAVELAGEAGSEALRGDAYALLAIVARRRGALAEANSLYAQASRLYWQCGNLSGHASVLLNRAWAVGLIGLLPSSVRLFEEAQHQANLLGRETTDHLARLGLGWVALRGGEFRAARRRLLPLWRAARRRGRARDEALALGYLAELYLLSGRLRLARAAQTQAQRLALRLAPRGDLGISAHLRRALLAHAAGEPAAAQQAAREAVALARAGGLRWEEAQGLRLRGQALAHLDRREEARGALRRAHEILVGMGEQLERGLVEVWLAALDPRAAAQASPPEPKLEAGISSAARFWRSHALLAPPAALRSGTPAPPHRPTDMLAGAGGATGNRDAASLGSRAGTGSDTAGDSAAVGPRADGTAERHPRRRPPRRTELPPPWCDLGFVSRAPRLLEALRQVEVFAPSQIPILILGETGTGKDLVARAIHALSGHAGRYVPVNCAAARKDLFVAELFGARRGAYTGAVRDRRGLIEEAADGTLFFDEVGDLESEAQGYLLRFLDSGEVRALGETRNRRVQARVVAATCLDLGERVAAGLFRPDLFGRLAGLVVHIPPLRERPEDIPLIARALWLREGGGTHECERFLQPPVSEVLAGWSWPGNVRELRHTIARAMLVTQAHGVEAARRSLPHGFQALGAPGGSGSAARGGPWPSTRPPWQPPVEGVRGVAVERAPDADLVPGSAAARARRPRSRTRWDGEELRRVLAQSDGRIALAARALGISRSHAYRLYRRLDEGRL